MACIKKIDRDLSFSCETQQSGLRDTMLGRYSEAILINASDIVSYSVADPTLAEITMTTTKKGFVVQGVNNGIAVTFARIGGTTYQAMFDASVKLTMPTKFFSGGNGEASNFMLADVVVALKGSNGYTVFGLGAPLANTEIEGDSTASEFITMTYGVEEGQVGTTFYGISKTVYDGLKIPKV